jgi:uncharacterized protein YbaA (DUF1428 family)
MAHYVDGFVLPIPKQNVDAYRELAREAGEVWIEHGALEYKECVAEDVKEGELTSFPQGVKATPDETVFFSWIKYESRADRDAINAKVMADPRLKGMMDSSASIFDSKRMVYGGFEIAVDL